MRFYCEGGLVDVVCRELRKKGGKRLARSRETVDIIFASCLPPVGSWFKNKSRAALNSALISSNLAAPSGRSIATALLPRASPNSAFFCCIVSLPLSRSPLSKSLVVTAAAPPPCSSYPITVINVSVNSESSSTGRPFSSLSECFTAESAKPSATVRSQSCRTRASRGMSAGMTSKNAGASKFMGAHYDSIQNLLCANFL